MQHLDIPSDFEIFVLLVDLKFRCVAIWGQRHAEHLTKCKAEALETEEFIVLNRVPCIYMLIPLSCRSNIMSICKRFALREYCDT